MDQWYFVLLIVVALGLVMVFSGSRSQERTRTTARLAAVERKLDLVIRHLEIADEPTDDADVIGHLEQGQLIQAIKIYRERTGVGLAEAKAAVEAIARQRGLDAR
jgi:ribosomal protein L7/L12